MSWRWFNVGFHLINTPAHDTHQKCRLLWSSNSPCPRFHCQCVWGYYTFYRSWRSPLPDCPFRYKLENHKFKSENMLSLYSHWQCEILPFDHWEIGEPPARHMALMIRDTQGQNDIHVSHGGTQHEANVEDQIEAFLKRPIVSHRLHDPIENGILSFFVCWHPADPYCLLLLSC